MEYHNTGNPQCDVIARAKYRRWQGHADVVAAHVSECFLPQTLQLDIREPTSKRREGKDGRGRKEIKGRRGINDPQILSELGACIVLLNAFETATSTYRHCK